MTMPSNSNDLTISIELLFISNVSGNIKPLVIFLTRPGLLIEETSTLSSFKFNANLNMC